MTKDYWKKILIRAWHAVWETAAATLPATIVITPAMIEHFDKSLLVAVAAWLATALAAGVVSIIKSLAIGIPEAKNGSEVQNKVNLDTEEELYEVDTYEAENDAAEEL